MYLFFADECPKCQAKGKTRRFSEKKNLDSHTRSLHPEADAERYPCLELDADGLECPRKNEPFTTKGSLTQHREKAHILTKQK